jgi:hypothetical protein
VSLSRASVRCVVMQACAAVRQLALPRSARKARRWSPPPPRALAMLKAVACAELCRCTVRIGAGLSRTVRHFCVCVTAQAPAPLREARAGQCKASAVRGAAAARRAPKSARDAATGLRLAQPSAPRCASLLALKTHARAQQRTERTSSSPGPSWERRSAGDTAAARAQQRAKRGGRRGWPHSLLRSGSPRAVLRSAARQRTLQPRLRRVRP